jgi:hypothetical protein
MKKSRKIRKCKYCGSFFCPDRRVEDRQKACSRDPCKRKRKKEAQDFWISKNEGYFNNRYENTKEWRKKNPNYQQKWRRLKKEREIQDKFHPQEPLLTLKLVLPVKYLKTEIQDEITLTRKSGSVYYVYGSRRKIQDKIEHHDP